MALRPKIEPEIEKLTKFGVSMCRVSVQSRLNSASNKS